jgi:hypothetical protein
MSRWRFIRLRIFYEIMALEIRKHSRSIATRPLDNERPNVQDGSDSNLAIADAPIQKKSARRMSSDSAARATALQPEAHAVDLVARAALPAAPTKVRWSTVCVPRPPFIATKVQG